MNCYLPLLPVLRKVKYLIKFLSSLTQLLTNSLSGSLSKPVCKTWSILQMLALNYMEEKCLSWSQIMRVNLCILGEAAFPHLLAREQEELSERGDDL